MFIKREIDRFLSKMSKRMFSDKVVVVYVK